MDIDHSYDCYKYYLAYLIAWQKPCESVMKDLIPCMAFEQQSSEVMKSSQCLIHMQWQNWTKRVSNLSMLCVKKSHAWNANYETTIFK